MIPVYKPVHTLAQLRWQMWQGCQKNEAALSRWFFEDESMTGEASFRYLISNNPAAKILHRAP